MAVTYKRVNYKRVNGVVEIFYDGTLINAVPPSLLTNDKLWEAMRMAHQTLETNFEHPVGALTLVGVPKPASVVIKSQGGVPDGEPPVIAIIGYGTSPVWQTAIQGWRLVGEPWNALVSARAHWEFNHRAARLGCYSVWDGRPATASDSDALQKQIAAIGGTILTDEQRADLRQRFADSGVPGYPSAGVDARGNRGGAPPRAPRLLEQVDAAAAAWRDETHVIMREMIDVLKETTAAYAKGLVTFHDGTGEIVTRGATILMLEIVERLQRSMQEHRDVLAQRDLRIENLLVENAALLAAHGQARLWEERCNLLSGENLALKREIDPLRRLAAAHDAKVIEIAELRTERQLLREELDDREEEVSRLLDAVHAADHRCIDQGNRIMILRSIWGIDMVDTEA